MVDNISKFDRGPKVNSRGDYCPQNGGCHVTQVRIQQVDMIEFGLEEHIIDNSYNRPRDALQKHSVKTTLTSSRSQLVFVIRRVIGARKDAGPGRVLFHNVELLLKKVQLRIFPIKEHRHEGCGCGALAEVGCGFAKHPGNEIHLIYRVSVEASTNAGMIKGNIIN